MITLTMRHDRGQRLGMLWDALAKAWRRVITGKAWVNATRKFGIVGWVRVVEVTIGKNGWHIHIHALLFADDLTVSNLNVLADAMWNRWSAGLQSAGLRAPTLDGQNWHMVEEAGDGSTIGDYLAKWFSEPKAAAAIGAEMTLTQSKVTQKVHSTRPVWALLEEGALDGEAGPLWAWHEWERGSKGRRQIGWSTGLREELGLLLPEKTDEEIAAEELGSADDTVVWITRQGWGDLLHKPKLIPDVLNAAEQLSVDGLCEWLTENGIEHRRAK
jgi:hypothetical protein